MSANQSYIMHQLNTSKTKQAHCFPKQKRFSKSTHLTQTIYKLPSTFNKRATSFGFGAKANLEIITSSPPPGTYHLASDFQRKDLMNITSFGESRAKISFGSFIWQSFKQAKNNPSPNRYNIAPIRCKIGGRISDRIKTQPDTQRKQPFPGPGQYKLESTDMKNHGNFIISTFKNNSCPRFFSSKLKTTKGSRLATSISYDIQEKQADKFVSSKYKNVVCRTFSKAQRPGLEDNTKIFIPGYKYRRFSQFGGCQ